MLRDLVIDHFSTFLYIFTVYAVWQHLAKQNSDGGAIFGEAFVANLTASHSPVVFRPAWFLAQSITKTGQTSRPKKGVSHHLCSAFLRRHAMNMV